MQAVINGSDSHQPCERWGFTSANPPMVIDPKTRLPFTPADWVAAMNKVSGAGKPLRPHVRPDLPIAGGELGHEGAVTLNLGSPSPVASGRQLRHGADDFRRPECGRAGPGQPFPAPPERDPTGDVGAGLGIVQAAGGIWTMRSWSSWPRRWRCAIAGTAAAGIARLLGPAQPHDDVTNHHGDPDTIQPSTYARCSGARPYWSPGQRVLSRPSLVGLPDRSACHARRLRRPSSQRQRHQGCVGLERRRRRRPSSPPPARESPCRSIP